MQWYYQKDGREAGPVDEDELRRLRDLNEFGDETLVWVDGMMDWSPYGAVLGDRAPAAAPAAAFGEPGDDQSTVVCSQCGGAFAPNHTLTLKGMVVCSGCKPVFLQRLKEGIDPTNVAHYGGFWIRGLARIIDSVILWVLMIVLMVPVMFLMALIPQVSEPGDSAAAAMGCVTMAVFWILQLAVMGGYEICFLHWKGATPGKMICRLKVVMADGAPLGWGRATGRFFGNMLTGMTFFIGYIIAAFDPEKKALHDMICNTRVIRLS